MTECLHHLRKGDTLHVYSMDRLARNMGDLLGMIKQLTGRGVGIRNAFANPVILVVSRAVG
ncbi:recombinase family protein [Alcanivoracaceae bacterium MT1]